ncbi:MAG: DUF2254 domain-containing protein [Thermoleophilaceae bacterium]|nr:DUF2254 domain-containing protein [Thermoleophilaceae bacterium]
MTRAATWFERARNTFWAVPAVAVLVATAAGVVLPIVDDTVRLPAAGPLTGEADTARAALQLIATLAVSVAGISFSVIVVALVLASQQLSPRVLHSFQRHSLNQVVLGVFLATATFSLFVLSAVEDGGAGVPELSLAVAMLLAVASLTLFVLFLHHAVRSLNASAVIRRIAADGHQAVHCPYPASVGREPAHERDVERELSAQLASCAALEVRAARAGYLMSVEAIGIIEAAEAADGFVEQEAVIGDFVVTGAVLARVWSPSSAREALVDRVREGSFSTRSGSSTTMSRSRCVSSRTSR